MNIRMIAAAGLTAAAMASTAFGLDGRIAPFFVERQGIKEFSGEMIARPLQIDALQKSGLTAVDAQAKLAAARGAMQAYNVREHVAVTDEYIFRVPAGQTENDVAEGLMATGGFQYVHPNWIVYPVDCPNDSRFDRQWHHDDDHFQSCSAWVYGIGDPSVSVGICDTGLRATHQDLLLNRLEGYNAVDRRWESAGGVIEDINGHGTATTGCAAANGNNGVGVAGVAYNVSHRILKVSNDPGGGASMDTLTHAARTSIESGDKVANVSYSGVDSASVLEAADYIRSIGGILVWSAGNEARELMGGRDNDALIVVGATDEADRLASFSNFGEFVDVVAPGQAVYTTSAASDGAYGYADGTSFSSPLTAGLIALMWSINPDLDADQLETMLKETCDDLGSPGVDDNYGYGRINALEAVRRANNPIYLSASTNFVAHEFVNVDVYGGLPNQEVQVYYSLRGLGECPLPELGVVLEIRNCRLALAGTTDSAGVRTWSVRLPRVNRPTPIALQAAQASDGQAIPMISNIVVRRIQP